jgi:hypothetical protein
VVPFKIELSDFRTYCLAKHGMGVDPRTCKDEAFLRSLVRFSVERALASRGGSATRESGSPASISTSFTRVHSAHSL